MPRSVFGSVNEMSVVPCADTFCTIMSMFTPASASARKTRAAMPGVSGTETIVAFASEAKVTVQAVPDRPGIAARVFRALADAGVNIDMIVQNVSEQGTTDISFTLPKTDLPAAEPILDVLAKEVEAGGVLYDPEIAKVSLVGAGMKSHPGVAADMFEALADAGINIEIISTSTIRVSCVVRAADVERAVQAVHERFRMFAEERVGG